MCASILRGECLYFGTSDKEIFKEFLRLFEFLEIRVLIMTRIAYILIVVNSVGFGMGFLGKN